MNKNSGKTNASLIDLRDRAVEEHNGGVVRPLHGEIPRHPHIVPEPGRRCRHREPSPPTPPTQSGGGDRAGASWVGLRTGSGEGRKAATLVAGGELGGGARRGEGRRRRRLNSFCHRGGARVRA